MSDVAIDLHDDLVGLLEIRRGPENYFDVPLLAELVGGARELASRGCRAIVLASEGRHFCAGADYAAGDPGEGPELFDLAFQLFEQPLPMVAAVQGAAVGGGLGLALAADVRVATPEARFAALFARLGISHGFGLTLTLPALVGQQTALDLLYTGRRVPGEEAVRLGLADHLVPADRLRPTSSPRRSPPRHRWPSPPSGPRCAGHSWTASARPWRTSGPSSNDSSTLTTPGRAWPRWPHAAVPTSPPAERHTIPVPRSRSHS
jgi:2-(1,2-epoxy-1,2-dihydrophenyl)acetyl-CoA isomerase